MKLFRTEYFEDDKYIIEKKYYDSCVITNKHPKTAQPERDKLIEGAGKILLHALKKLHAK